MTDVERLPPSLRWINMHSSTLAEDYRRQRSWLDRTLADCLHDAADTEPERKLYWETTRRVAVREIYESAHALVRSLADLGLRPGDVISFQLPNWTEAAIIDCAASIGGFVCNPIVLIYRDAELRQILPDCETRILFVPAQYRGFDYAEMAERARSFAPSLQHVVIVRGEGTLTLDALIDAGRKRPERRADVDPDRPKLVMYTSGTTGRAKGVVHSHNTVHCDLAAHARFWKIGAGDRSFVTGPVGHMSGYLYACNAPLQWMTDCAIVERWDVNEAADLIETLKLTFTVGATPFIQDLIALSRATGRKFPSLRLFACGGAPVPPEVIRSVFRTLPHCVSFRCYGSTEAPTTTLGISDIGDMDACALTDGEVYNNEVKIIGEDGETLPVGREGEIAVRGPERMLGYTRAEDNAAAFDAEGYWKSGDLGVIDAKGRITVTGRKKDLIIRGGENLSAKEIEDVLHAHPDILQASVVGAPHPRLGEVVCAFVVLRGGASVDLPELSRHLTAAGLARQKLPERLNIVDALPMTAFGKVRKNVLKERMADVAPA